MADTGAAGSVRIRSVRLRVGRSALPLDERSLAEAVRRQLPGHLDPAVRESVATEMAAELAAELTRAAGRVGARGARP